MEIKQKREVTLPELIAWGWENNKSGVFPSINNKFVQVDIGVNYVDTFFGDIMPYPDSLFEIEDDIPVDETTVLDNIIEVYKLKTTGIEKAELHKRTSLSILLKQDQEDCQTTRLLYLNPDGTTTLLWKDGKMVDPKDNYN